MEYKNINGSKVFIGEDASVLRGLTEVFEQGALCIVFDDKLGDVCDEVTRELKSAYRLFTFAVPSRRSGRSFESPSPPEYVRHVLGVGAGSVAEECKRLAGMLDVEWSLYLTAPSTNAFMRGKPPKSVFINKNILLNCPFECIAAGYGILYSTPLDAFERFFKSKAAGSRQAEAEQFEFAETDAAKLAVKLLSLPLDDEDNGADVAAKTMYLCALREGRKPRLIGEYRFIASVALISIYSAFLSAMSFDVMPPPSFDDDVRAKKLCEGAGLPLKKVDFFDVNGYFRISYILSEYRMDLLDRLSGADLRSAKRSFRRAYPDAGYRLRNEITCRDVEKAIFLAGALSDGLLGFVYASGALTGLR